MENRPRPPRPAPRPGRAEERGLEKGTAGSPAARPPVGAPAAVPFGGPGSSSAADSGRWAKKTMEMPLEVMDALVEQSAPSTSPVPVPDDQWAKRTVEASRDTLELLVEQSVPSTIASPKPDDQWAKKTIELSREAMEPLVGQSVPSSPSVPTMPATPAVPTMPATPAVPTMPAAPTTDDQWVKQTREVSHDAMAPLVEQTRSATEKLPSPLAARSDSPPLTAENSLPSSPKDARVSRWMIPVVAISFAAVFGIGVGLYIVRKRAPAAAAVSEVSEVSQQTAPPATVADVTREHAAPPPAPTEPEPSAKPAAAEGAAPRSPSPQDSVEIEAREALTRLRDGILACARGALGILPGTSPAVPANLASLKAGAYGSVPRDWSTPVWYCANFKQQAPQRFQIQWQMLKPAVEGMGVAWLDDDADGKPDRAFGFHATLKQKGNPEAGEVSPIDASHPVAPPPR